ncbi:magnesium-protoporphyrin IX monomethyl ester [oxidative] cyclase, chloroplastic-like [Camellia sinensis]|uniref:magnesium-protoporphyrin IX monomethyl ester [oxidative] cyclase, chloroplastic-like n=1 Tax=Camellia sinensis TaxID=4442 RepID=UPI001036D4DC|nr:magnesium-protoporphyrin IX monomethyl ester [oxidative] cyclase, chloroplastic-like [Camellia sinensis]
MAAEMALVKPISISKFNLTRTPTTTTKFSTTTTAMSATTTTTTTGPIRAKAAKKGIKESLLTPRFYTTDFDEMEMLFNTEINKKLNQEEFEALLQEFKTDYNQTHFMRNKEFKEAADQMQGGAPAGTGGNGRSGRRRRRGRVGGFCRGRRGWSREIARRGKEGKVFTPLLKT